MVSFLSAGHPDLVKKIRVPTNDDADEFMNSLLCSLNSEFALHLDTSAGNPQQPEGGEDQQVLEEDVLVIVARASHAEWLANAISNRHGNVADLTLPGWHLTEDTAEDLEVTSAAS